MKILNIWVISMGLLMANNITLEDKLTKEIMVDKITLGKTTFSEVKQYYGFGFKMYDYIYKGKSYKSKDMCLYDKTKKLYLYFSSSAIPSSFRLIDWVEISSQLDKTSFHKAKCHRRSISIHTQNYLGLTKQQIVKLFGESIDKGLRYKDKNEYYSYSYEKTIQDISLGRLRELYPSKSISFDFNKDGKVLKYTIGTPMEYGKYINDEKLCERVQNKQLLSEKDFLKIINNTAIYKLKECDLNLNARVDIRSSPTFLIQAIRHRKYKTIQYLLNNKADIEGIDGNNNTPLLVAIGYKDKMAIKLLLKYNANILVKNKDGKSAKKLLKEMNIDVTKFMITPKFKNYSILSQYKDKNHHLIQKNFGRLYRTLLKKALKEKKPEFAGKHIIAQWGCDDGKNECTTGGIIDASTGKATEFPFKYYAHNGSKEIIYKLNSSLIIFAGDFEFKDGRREKNKVLFYEFKNDEFLFLKATEYKK